MDREINLPVAIKQYGVTDLKGLYILDKYGEVFSPVAVPVFARNVDEMSKRDPEAAGVSEEAKEERLKIRRIRIDVENTRVELKAGALKEGKAIDGLANLIKSVLEPMEESLKGVELFIERKREAEETARREKAEKLLKEQEERDDEERIAKAKRDNEQRELELAAEREKARQIEVENARLQREAKEAREAQAERDRRHEAELRKEREAADEKLHKERVAAAQRERAAAEEAKALKAEADLQRAIDQEAKEKLVTAHDTDLEDDYIDIVFDGDTPMFLTFVEVEDAEGKGINVGEWVKRKDGHMVLRLKGVDRVTRGPREEING